MFQKKETSDNKRETEGAPPTKYSENPLLLTPGGQHFFFTMLLHILQALQKNEQRLFYFDDFFGRNKSHFETHLKKNIITNYPMYASFGALGANNHFSVFSEFHAFGLRKLGRITSLFISDFPLCPQNTLTRVDTILRRAKRNNLPYGGVSVFIFGDSSIVYSKTPPLLPEAFEIYDIKQFAVSEYARALYKFAKTRDLEIFAKNIKHQPLEQFLDSHFPKTPDAPAVVVPHPAQEKCRPAGNVFMPMLPELEWLVLCSQKKDVTEINNRIRLRLHATVAASKPCRTKSSRTKKKTIREVLTHSYKFVPREPVVSKRNAKRKGFSNGSRFLLLKDKQYCVLINRFAKHRITTRTLTSCQFETCWAATIHRSLLIKEYTCVYVLLENFFDLFLQLYMALGRVEKFSDIVLSRPLTISS